MANPKTNLKHGMAGSSNGKSRSEKTEDLKQAIKKQRRQEDKIEVRTNY